MSIIGINIGGTKCSVSRLRGDRELEVVGCFATSAWRTTVDRMLAAVGGMGVGEAPVFGVSCGGPWDSGRGVILSPPNLPGWDEVHITEELTSRFGGEAYLMNDANACALAEWQMGAGRGTRNMVFLTFGTGMGAGLIIDGRLYEGTSGNAGEVGHIRLAEQGPEGYGKVGSFEGFCSGGGIARLVHQAARAQGRKLSFFDGRLEDVTAADVAAGAASGDAFAREIFAEVGRRLGEGLAIIIDILNPQMIVIGSIYARCRELLEPSMTEVLVKEALPQALGPCKIVPAALGEEIGDWAAVTIALYRSGQLA
jgi:glucokinase